MASTVTTRQTKKGGDVTMVTSRPPLGLKGSSSSARLGSKKLAMMTVKPAMAADQYT